MKPLLSLLCVYLNESYVTLDCRCLVQIPWESNRALKVGFPSLVPFEVLFHVKQEILRPFHGATAFAGAFSKSRPALPPVAK